MTDRSVDKKHVKNNKGVYFYLYSVPDVIFKNRNIDFDVGSERTIYHLSILYSDGNGVVETITAGPEESIPLYKQLGQTPLKIHLSYLEHNNSSLVEVNFDTTAWNYNHIHQKFASTNWSYHDFSKVKNHIERNIANLSSISYNLGGHNSNSLTTYIWKVVSSTRAVSGQNLIDNPNEVFASNYRPGSDHDLFDSSAGYVLSLFRNYSCFVIYSVFVLWKFALTKFGSQ